METICTRETGRLKDIRKDTQAERENTQRRTCRQKEGLAYEAEMSVMKKGERT